VEGTPETAGKDNTEKRMSSIPIPEDAGFGFVYPGHVQNARM